MNLIVSNNFFSSLREIFSCYESKTSYMYVAYKNNFLIIKRCIMLNYSVLHSSTRTVLLYVINCPKSVICPLITNYL